VGAIVALGAALAAPNAGAAVASVDIGAPSGPLTTVAVGKDLSCQVKHTGDTSLEFFPSAAIPGDCGTFIAVGSSLFGPDFANHDSSAASSVSGASGYAPFTAVSQSAKTGAGTTASPFRVVTTANAGSTGLAVTQTDSYVAGQESFRTDVTVQNTGGSPQSITLYRAGDCYLQNSDRGAGFAGGNGAVGCSANPNNTPPGRIEEWVPITGGNNFLEAAYSDVWSAIATRMPFSNQCARCSETIDNGSGISWTVTINPGQSVTFSHYTTFSPTGRAGPPPTDTGDLAAARLPTCLSIPSVVRNRLARVPGVGTVTLLTNQVNNPASPLKLNVRLAGRGGIRSVQFQVNGRTVAISVGGPFSTSVGIRSLRIGSRLVNRVTAIVVLNSGVRVSLTQFMVILRCHVPAATCKRLGNGQRLQCRSNTPLGGRRINVTVTRSAAETATGSATVRRGAYTVIVRARIALGAGTYAYKAVVFTNRRGERFQMIRLVTVR
jgi:hypothetical protein